MNQPIWTRGRVPNGYWSTRANRVRYMVWLRKRVGFRKTDDWYRLTRRHFLENHGGGLLATVYQHSPIVALRDYAPDVDWLPWRMSKVPQGYWRDPRNRKRYLTCLGQTLGFKRNADWYQLSKAHFLNNDGDGLLANYFRNSPIDAVREHKPNVVWNEWLFAEASQRFWYSKDNRASYLAWLGKRLRYRTPADWRKVKRRDFIRNHGSSLLQLGYSPLQLLREAYPKEPWHEWEFYRVPNGFWKASKNRTAYLRWLGKTHMGFRKPGDWERITRQDVRGSGGGTLLSEHFGNSMTRFRTAAARATRKPTPRRR